MKRNNFIRAVFALPFIAPLLAKGKSQKLHRIEDNPLYHMKPQTIGTLSGEWQWEHTESGETIIKKVWKEEDVKVGMWVVQDIGKYKIVEQFLITENGTYRLTGSDIRGEVSYSTNCGNSMKVLLSNLNGLRYRRATEDEVIEMIRSSKSI